MFVRRFLGVRNEFNQCENFLSSFVRKFHQTKFLGIEKVGGIELETDAVEWLANLSPEMKDRKQEVECLLGFVEEKFYKLKNVKLSAADIKYIMTECKSYKEVERYVLRTKSMDELIVKIKDQTITNEQDCFNSTYGQRERFYKYRLLSPLMFDLLPVVFDMDYNQTFQEQSSANNQLLHCMYINMMYHEPCSIHITSYKKNQPLDVKTSACSLAAGVIMHEESFEEIFPQEKLVYLSPHAPQLRYHNPGDIYVLGGLQDQEPNKPLSLKKARQKKIRCGSIPFGLHNATERKVKGVHGFILDLESAFKLTLSINLSHNWKSVIRDYIASTRPNHDRN